MDLRTELSYDRDPATVFAMLTDEEYLARKAQATNAIRHEASVTRDGERVTVRLLRVMPPDVPDFVRRFVGDAIHLDQTDVWQPPAPDGSRAGTIDITMSGAPVTFNGRMSLTGSGGGTAVVVDGAVKASVPLVGGKIEEAVHNALLEAARREHEVGQAWLTTSAKPGPGAAD